MTPSQRNRIDLAEQMVAVRLQIQKRRTAGEMAVATLQILAALALLAIGAIGLIEMQQDIPDPPPGWTYGIRGEAKHRAQVALGRE